MNHLTYAALNEAAVGRLASKLLRCVEGDRFARAKIIMKNKNREDRKRVVTKTFDGNAALFVACEQGLVHFVNYFLDECDADIEQRGVYFQAESHSKHMVTPLWYSVMSNHKDVLKALLNHGADVNATPDTQNTPVHCACYATDLETVKLLFEHGADIHKPNADGVTCLMSSVQSVDLCRFLIENNVSVNAQKNSGNAALHYAIREDRMDTVELLLKQGADVNMKNCLGDDAFRTASLRGSPSILAVLMQHSQPSIQCKIESHELLGTNFVDEKNDIQKALQEWQTAMLLRQQHNVMLSPDDTKPPLQAYMNQVEAITMEELTALTASSDRVYMQSLMVRERLLGPGHKDTLFGLMYRGAVYADSHSYQRCVDLWKYAFNLHHCLNERVTQGGLHTLQTLCKLFLEINEEHSGGFTNEAVRYEDVSSIFNTICDDVEAIFLCRMNCIQQTASEEEFQTLVLLLLHTILLVNLIASDPNDILAFRRRIQQLLNTNCSVADGRSLLHLAMVRQTSFVRKEFYSKFPNKQVVELLVECGADVNASDDRKDTPLHLCSKLKKIVAPTELAKLAEVLIASGAHLDARNKRGKLASDGLTQLPLQLRPLDHVTLKCLAARMIKIRKIAYEGEVPESLHKFIELH